MGADFAAGLLEISSMLMSGGSSAIEASAGGKALPGEKSVGGFHSDGDAGIMEGGVLNRNGVFAGRLNGEDVCGVGNSGPES